MACRISDFHHHLVLQSSMNVYPENTFMIKNEVILSGVFPHEDLAFYKLWNRGTVELEKMRFSRRTIHSSE